MGERTPNVITCKAAVVRELGGRLLLETIKVDPPKTKEVRIKMLCASICHTDILCCNDILGPIFPRIPGHEGVGMIESIGDEVDTDLKPGDIVIPLFIGECGKCLNCKSEKTNMCHNYPSNYTGLMSDGTSRMSMATTGETVHHCIGYSTWSEYTVIDANYVLKIDPTLPLPYASILSCGFTTGLGAPWKEAAVHNGSSVVVFGLGAVGLGVIQGAKMQGASTIIGVDLNEKRASKGKALGMTDFINPNDHVDKPITDLIKAMTNGLGVDYCFECTGVASLLNEALESSKIGLGVTVAIGLGQDPNLPIKALTLLGGRTLKGSYFGGIRTRSDLPIIVRKCINKEIEVDEIITHEIKLENIHEAFEMVKKPDCVKILIKFF